MKIRMTKEVGGGEIMELWETKGKVCGLVLKLDGLVMNEAWTKEACEELVAAGEMKIYEDELCVSCEDVMKLWETNSRTFDLT